MGAKFLFLKKVSPLFFTLPLFLILFSGCSRYFYYPDHVLHYPPKDFKFSPQEIHFKASDETKLFGWFFKAYPSQPHKKPKGTFIQFHGNAENISSHYLTLVWLVHHGYNLFIFDYRGYGRSDGKPTQEGTYLDGLAGLNKGWELHQKSGAKKFFVYGQSLGGAIAMRALQDFKHRNDVQLIVLDSTFSSYQRVARRTLSSHWATWIFSPLAWILISDEYSSEDAVRTNPSRLLVIHDKKDPSVSYQCGQDIYEAATSQKDFWSFENGYHVAIFALAYPENRIQFIDYLNALSR